MFGGVCARPGPFPPRSSVGSAAALQWQRGVGSWRQIVLNVIMDESIASPEGLEDSAVGELEALC